MQDYIFAGHTFLVDTYMFNYIHTNQLRCVFLPEVIMNTCNVQFQGILYQKIYIILFWSTFLYLPVH